ncbi:DUF4432 family protein [Nonomuraea cavernae]|uniref:DUF4432 domain-containing protein n=1 Tax=Nonomuraea cavernae TaxID=2045107 RepID=A0A918DEL2_9ACTN|nr:DUF4432 family protein [Nonomuraea cavernae]MCA2183890.1 DUF4432 family protein [Nonomuraea cavernae]GGO61684.1 hypothetical protein GCM10012289_04500 [Nonomuraea cavernae]
MRRNWGARLRHVVIDGLRAVVLENERLRVTVVPGKGGDVVEFLHKPSDTDFVWLSPQGLRDPAGHLQGASDDVAQFVDHYEGGWQEVFPNGGAPSEYRGARLAQHGEVAGLPWEAEVVADSEQEVAVRLRVRTRRLPYLVERTLRVRSGTAALEIEGRATNESGVEVHAMWGQHIVYGRPFLRPGARIRLPAGVIVVPHESAINPAGRLVRAGGPWTWPVVPAEGGGEIDLSVVGAPGAPSDIVYLTGFTEGWYEISADVGLRVEWDAALLPHLWMWQEFGATTGYPWWGRAYTLGLEPFSSMPTDGLATAVANGTALTLAPYASKVSRLRAEVLA